MNSLNNSLVRSGIKKAEPKPELVFGMNVVESKKAEQSSLAFQIG